MKRTEIERKDREFRRKLKKEQQLAGKMQMRDQSKVTHSVGDFIKLLSGLYRYDESEIYNLHDDRILEVLVQVKEEVPQRKWDDVLRKSIRSTKIAQRESAFSELKSLLEA